MLIYLFVFVHSATSQQNFKQMVGVEQAGVKMIYIAMFDEIDEGTAIFKISKYPPVGVSNFVTLKKIFLLIIIYI